MFLMCNYICTVCISSVINAASSPGLRIPIEIGNSPGGVSYIMISKVYYCVYAMGIVFFLDIHSDFYFGNKRWSEV